MTALEHDLQHEKMMTGSQKQQITDLQAAIRTPRHVDQIAFSVYSESNFGPVSDDTNIPYPYVNTNVGDAWLPQANTFMATIAGVYLFSTSMRGLNDTTVYVKIVHATSSGSQVAASLYSPRDLYTGDANTVILEVDVGDLVYVQLNGGEITSSSDNPYSTFSGFLIFNEAQEGDRTAFSVHSRSSFGPVSVDTIIPYDYVHTNIGGAWLPQVNTFQATRAGVYLFSTSIQGLSDEDVYVAIVHATSSGSETAASLYSPSGLYTGDANTVILEVDVGDFVSVQLNGGTIGSSSSYRYSTFSGFLLF